MSNFDDKDRLIFALCALLRAERETRAAFEAALASGAVSREALSAILSDPIPVVTNDDLRLAEELARSVPHAAIREAA
jgi:hypothetical protein